MAALNFPSSFLAVARREYAFTYRSSKFKASVQSFSASSNLQNICEIANDDHNVKCKEREKNTTAEVYIRYGNITSLHVSSQKKERKKN